MEYNQIVTISLNDKTTVYGSVIKVHNNRRITVTVEADNLVGFSPIFNVDFTKRKNGKWVRVGVDMNRGWCIH